MKRTKQKESAALKAHDLYFESYIKGDIDTLSALLVENYSQIGSAEDEVFFTKNDALKFVFATIDQVVGKLEMRNRSTTQETFDEFILIFELCDLYVLIEQEWTFYSRFRATSVLQEKPEGWKIVHQHSSFPDSKAQEGENIALEKISEENLQLRDAIKRRTVELENKNRELEIEAALERVRASAMSMQRSEDLKTVVGILYGQLRNLGFKMGVASIIIMDQESGDMEWWNEGFGDGYVLPECYHVPFFEHPGHLQQLKLWKSGTSFAEIEISGPEKKSFDAYYFYRTDFSRAPESTKQLMMQQETLLFSMAFMKYGALSWSPMPLSENQATILERFAKVFEQTYTRFLDLKKAEAQAREAKIEAALERTRVKAMSIQRSDELKEIVKVVFDTLLELDFIIRDGAVSILVFEKESKDHIQWIADPGHVFPPFKVEFSDHSLLTDIISGWENGSIGYQKIYPYEEKRNYFEFLIEHNPAYNALPLEIKNLLLESREYGYSIAFGKHSALSVATNIGKLLTPNEFEILRRFSNVFDQAYTRFLDILKAEAQALEAQIEAALERVRARTMAMQKSEDLRTVVEILYGQLRNLGFQFGVASITIMDPETGNIDWWMEGIGDGYVLPERYHVPFFNHPGHLQQLEYWKSGTSYAEIEISGPEKKTYDAYYFYKTDFSRAPESSKNLMMQQESVRFSMAFMKYGALCWSPTPLSKDQATILERFAKVFEQCYTRFLDLQIAEMQAREAQIETALERVRAKAMAMHKSEELRGVIQLVYEQLVQLNIRVHQAGFIMDYKKHDDWYLWMADYIQPIPTRVHFRYFDHPMFDLFKDAKAKGLNFSTINLTQEEKNSLIAESYKYNPGVPNEIKEVIFSLPGYAMSASFNENIVLFVANFEGTPLTDQENEVIRKFGKVFEQSYTRFLDLQNVEAQAREAHIEAALEKVRSRSLAMHHSSELEQVVGSLFDRLVELGLSFDGAGIFEFDRENRKISLWIATTHLAAPARIHLPWDPEIEKNQIWRDLWNAFEKRVDIFERTYPVKVKNDYFHYVAKYNPLPEAVRAIHQEKNWTAYFASSKYALIGFDSWSGHVVKEEDFKVMSRFASVFDQCYTRFLDLQKAEAQAREAQIEAALERVRSQSMAMHKSEDLLKVITVVSEQLKQLNFKFNTVSFAINSQKHDYSFWFAILGDPNPIYIQVPYIESPMFDRMKEVLASGIDFYADTLTPEENRKWHEHVFAHSVLPSLTEETKAYILRSGYARSIAIKPSIMLIVSNYSGKPYSDSENEIIKRFGTVFEQSFTRFLDLQKAEAQAREAHIEAALERVRSRSLAMNKSEELQEVVTTVFDRLKELDIQTDAINLDVFNENKKDAYLWTAVPGHSYSKAIHIPYTDATIFKDIYEGMISGKLMHSKVYSRQSKDEFLTYLFEHTDFRDSPQERKDFLYSADASTVSVAYAKNTAIIAQRYRNDPFSEVENEILKRFAKVFEQCYTRFLDLRKAETQAREAQIEVALERIRARALAMQSSTELSDVANVLREQMGILGQEDLEASVVHLYSEGSPTFDSWYAFRAGEKIIEGQTTFQLENSALAKEFLKLYLDEITEYTIEVKGEKLKDWLAEIKRNAPEIAAYWGDLPPEKQFYHFSDFSGGALLMVSHKTLSEETRMLQKRCAWVFELAYKRFLDLVAKERQDKELREEKQRLERALSELKATQSQLIQHEKLASLGQLTAGIAHEIKNPLNFVNNFSEVSMELIGELQEEREKTQEARNENLIGEILDDIKNNLQKVHEHGIRADEIVKSMLQHSRGSSGKMEPTDINSLIREFVNLSFHGMRAGKNPIDVEINLDLDGSIGEVPLISEDFSRVIINLCNNAFDAMREKGKTYHEISGGNVNYIPQLKVASKKLDGRVLISVEDNGSGIPDEIKEKIFEPFFTTKKGTEGTGLGLSITNDIIKAHRGDIRLSSEKSNGSKFIVLLPAYRQSL